MYCSAPWVAAHSSHHEEQCFAPCTSRYKSDLRRLLHHRLMFTLADTLCAVYVRCHSALLPSFTPDLRRSGLCYLLSHAQKLSTRAAPMHNSYTNRSASAQSQSAPHNSRTILGAAAANQNNPSPTETPNHKIHHQPLLSARSLNMNAHNNESRTTATLLFSTSPRKPPPPLPSRPRAHSTHKACTAAQQPATIIHARIWAGGMSLQTISSQQTLSSS